MKFLRPVVAFWFVLCGPPLLADSFLIRNGTVVDGTGSKPRKADVRVEGDHITAVGKLSPRAGETVIDARDFVVAPGFIDTHSHAEITAAPFSELIILQGITTAVVGQDGSHHFPLTAAIETHDKNPASYNVASFVGHGTVHEQVMKEKAKEHASEGQIAKMAALVEQEMAAGALGLSSGLEYDPGFYSTTEEVIACAKAAAGQGGIYISHMRNEDNKMFEALDELIRIGREAGCPAQVSHIKLGSKAVWGKAPEVLRRMQKARNEGLDISADVYPYLFWQSSITVLIPTRNWDDRAAWQKGLDDIGGPEHVLLGKYSPDSSWAGKTIAELATKTGKDPISVIQEIVSKTHGPGTHQEDSEDVVVTAMREDDLRAFLKDPHIMICSDGSPGGAHPRAAGTYPRILGKYVRQEKILTLQAAIRKMTSLPAARMGFSDRGTLRPGMKADIVVFNPDTIIDRSTTAEPTLPATGMLYVLVNGTAVLSDGKPTGAAPGRFLLHTPKSEKTGQKVLHVSG